MKGLMLAGAFCLVVGAGCEKVPGPRSSAKPSLHAEAREPSRATAGGRDSNPVVRVTKPTRPEKKLPRLDELTKEAQFEFDLLSRAERYEITKVRTKIIKEGFSALEPHERGTYDKYKKFFVCAGVAARLAQVGEERGALTVLKNLGMENRKDALEYKIRFAQEVDPLMASHFVRISKQIKAEGIKSLDDTDREIVLRHKWAFVSPD
jgi:hypothetical protein